MRDSEAKLDADANQGNLETLGRLQRVGETYYKLRSPGKYLRSLAKRMAYLSKEAQNIQGAARTYLTEELAAICWLTASYAAHTDYNVRSILEREGGVNLKLYDRIAGAVASQKCRKARWEDHVHQDGADAKAEPSEPPDQDLV